MSEKFLPLQFLPGPLQEDVQSTWNHILDSSEQGIADGYREYLLDESSAQQLMRAWACSRFISQYSRIKPELFLSLLRGGDLQRSYKAGEMAQSLSNRIAQCTDREQLMSQLRQFRQREMLRIIWRDFNRLGDMTETTLDVSVLAEVCIDLSLEFLQKQLSSDFGQPLVDGVEQKMVVIAMGKLGARELNVSSDIDMIFAYPEAGQTEGGRRSISNQEFFIKLAQQLIEAIDKTTAEGFVFRVDMRLRPYGESGALVVNFNAMEEYYQDQGRDWERYALIKARVISGDQDQGQQLMDALRPFVYRRYIDFGAIDALRSMKSMINTEVRRRNLHGNVKLGHGGIREVEFTVQCFQLIRGGRIPALQKRELLEVLEHCVEFDCLPREAVEELRAAYIFLRNTEHGIQGFADKQTQALPTVEYEQIALATVMGFSSWEEFLAVLDEHRIAVQKHFAAVVATSEEQEGGVDNESTPWPDDLDPDELTAFGFSDGEEVSRQLLMLRDSKRVQHMQAIGRERLNAYMPLLLQACVDSDAPEELLSRLLPLINSVLRRTAYLVLLIENPGAAAQLYKLCSASPWISDQMARYPVLLDELLDSNRLYQTPDRNRLRNELRQQVSRLAVDDLEGHMDTLRYFKAAQVLKVAACEVSQLLPLMHVSDNLTFIAEVILEHVLHVAWSDMVAKYGRPQHLEEAQTRFAVVGYGKMGGIELSYSSDLDLVFIYDMPANCSTDGERSIDGTVFYTRLGQRMIHILTAATAMGSLYEVDMRLRPSGESGLLVASINSFRDYQQNQAWTWEHQALVRARTIVGDCELIDEINSIRMGILTRPRSEPELASDVVEMREKMRAHLLPADETGKGLFSLKHGQGGIVDIEFMVQYAVLAWAHKFSELAKWSDNVRILEALEHTGLIEHDIRQALADAYIAYRSAAHELALQSRSDRVSEQRFAEHIEVVKSQWHEMLGSAQA